MNESLYKFLPASVLFLFYFLVMIFSLCAQARTISSEEGLFWPQKEKEYAQVDFTQWNRYQVVIDPNEYIEGDELNKNGSEKKGENNLALDFTLYLPPKPIGFRMIDPVEPIVNLGNPFASFYSFLKAHYLRDYSLFLDTLNDSTRESREKDHDRRKKIENPKDPIELDSGDLYVCYGVLQRNDIFLLILAYYEEGDEGRSDLDMIATMATTKVGDRFYISESLSDERITGIELTITLGQELPSTVTKYISLLPEIEVVRD